MRARGGKCIRILAWSIPACAADTSGPGLAVQRLYSEPDFIAKGNLALLRGELGSPAGHTVEFELQAQDILLLYYFTRIGINASARDLLARKCTASDYRAALKLEGDPYGALAGEVIVFTGALSLPRREIATIAASHGCNVAPGVTKKTTMLVVGEQERWRLAGNDKSSKHRKAEEFAAKSQCIQIMGEQGFMAALDLEELDAP